MPDAVLAIGATNGTVGDSLAAKTGPDGTALVQRVLAGSFSVSAVAGEVGGTATGTLAANAVQPVQVMLQPTASIAGTVFQPDGQNPVSAGVIVINSNQYPINSDGTYRIDGLRLDTHQLTVFDGQGRLRARVSVPLTTGAEIKQVDITFIALGTVRGRVITPEGSSATSFVVTLRSQHPILGGYFSSVTDAAGFYEIANVPSGAFTIATGDPSRNLLGEGSGSITSDGETKTVDVLLIANAIALPVTRHDANNFAFDVQLDGAIGTGTASAFVGNVASHGAALLDLVVGGTTNRFTGGIAQTEGFGREISVRQNLAGLSVTRKVFVPLDGYFTRYVEIVTNPTSAPVTLDLRLTSYIRSAGGVPVIVGTSSGDQVLSLTVAGGPDRWVVFDDGQDSDPFYSFNLPSLGFVFGGASAQKSASIAAFQISPVGRN